MLLDFTPPGPVAAAFMADRSPVSACMGPVGSGKTSACVMRILQQAAEQRPSILDGVRYSKWAVIRDTYRNLNRTTVKTFKGWLRGAGKWTGGGNEPAQLHLRAKLPDGTVMDLLVEFIALGDQSIEDVARGWEGTGVWLNEADLLPADALSYMFGRCGRYPGAIHGGPSWKGAILDYNAPDTENYCYRLFEEARPEGYTLYVQPGGRDPGAENLLNLPAGYYDEQVKMLLAQGRDDLVRRLVDNRYGFSRDGQPVYTEYNDHLHCAGRELEAVEGLPIKVSVDQDLHCAAVLRQTMPSGQRRYLEEIYCDTGAKGLAKEVLRIMAERYPGFKLVGGKADPAAEARDGNDAESWLDAFNRHAGLGGRERVTAAETNDPDKCTTAVRMRLTRLVDDGKPEILISSRCKVIRKGFNSAYCFKKKRMANGGFEDKPTKVRPTADVMNALEFDCLDDGGYQEVVGREKRAQGWGSKGMFQAKMEVRV